MSAARAALVAKIKKCLALSASANEHEAAAALDRAQVLMQEHGISADDVELADVAQVLAKGTGAFRPPSWEATLAQAVARALDCRVVHYPQRDAAWKWDSRWLFVGIGPAAEIAGYAWAVLYRQLRRQRTMYIAGPLRRCKPTRRRQRADIFCQAWAVAVYSKVARLAPKPPISALIDRHIAASVGAVTKCDTRAAASILSGALADDWFRGRSAGQSTDLNAGLGAEQQLAIA